MKKLIFGKSLFLLKFRLVWLGCIFFLVLIFLWLKIVPGGQISYEKDFNRRINFGQGFIYSFTPQDRVDENSGRLPKMIGDPLYFSVFTPRSFSSAKLTISYRRHLTEKIPIIEAGVLADSIVWRYDLQPIENRIIDNLKSSWRILSLKDPLVLQAGNYYSDRNQFFQDLDQNNLNGCDYNLSFSCLAVYNYDLDLNPDLSSFSEEQPLIFDIPLRGVHNLFIYINKNPLELELEFVDLNQDKAANPISLILTQGQKIVARSDLPDLNNDLASGREENKSLSLSSGNIPAGIYKLEIKISDDTVIKRIKSSTNRLVFIHKLWPVSWGKDIEIFTDAYYLQAKALGPASCQEFFFNGEKFNIDVPYEQKSFYLKNAGNLNKIELSEDDVILENNAIFAFSEKNFFNPMIKKVDPYFQLSSDIKYIISNYETPKIKTAGFLEKTLEFDLRGAYRERGKYNFIISIPGLKPEEGSYVEIEKIKIEFFGRTLWQKIFNL
jgi:hypothetical protein